MQEERGEAGGGKSKGDILGLLRLASIPYRKIVKQAHNLCAATLHSSHSTGAPIHALKLYLKIVLEQNFRLPYCPLSRQRDGRVTSDDCCRRCCVMLPQPLLGHCHCHRGGHGGADRRRRRRQPTPPSRAGGAAAPRKLLQRRRTDAFRRQIIMQWRGGEGRVGNGIRLRPQLLPLHLPLLWFLAAPRFSPTDSTPRPRCPRPSLSSLTASSR